MPHSIKELFTYYQKPWKPCHSSCYINDRCLVMILPNTQAMMPGQWTAVLASLVSATSLAPWPSDPGVSLWPSSHLSGSITNNYTSGEKQSQASKIPRSSLQRNDRFWTSKPKREKQDAPNHKGTGVTPVSTAVLIAADKTTFCTAHTSLRTGDVRPRAADWGMQFTPLRKQPC